MEVIINNARIARLRAISKYASLIGLVLLLGGLALAFMAPTMPNVPLYQLVALLAGWAISQVGIYLAHRYLRDPRPDEVLDEAVRKVVPHGRMYHYVLPAEHVLLTRSGPIVFVLKYQRGEISVDGDRWRQKGIGTARFFGQQSLGNPTREAEQQVKRLARFIHEQAPEIEEVPIGAIIVFTMKGLKTLDVERSTIPAMHATKLRGYLKQKGLGPPLPAETYETLRRIFDEAAGNQ